MLRQEHAQEGGTPRREQHTLAETFERRPLSRASRDRYLHALSVTGARAFDGDHQAGFFVDVHCDGSPSVTALLYIFSGDTAAGQTNGEGFADFLLARSVSVPEMRELVAGFVQSRKL